MFNSSNIDPHVFVIAVGIAAVVIALIVLMAIIVHATREIRQTVNAILGISENHNKTPSVSVRYGVLRPSLTFGRPKRMRIAVPVRSIPHVRTEEQANRLGMQIRDTYGFDSCETNLRRVVRHWELKR